MRNVSSIPLPPAPGADAHVSLALVNTAVTLPAGRRADALESPEEATQWLIDQALVPKQTALLAYCQNRLTGLREHLRAIFDAHFERQAPPEQSLAAVNGTLDRVPSALALRYDPQMGFSREPVHPVTQLVEHAMAHISEDAASLVTGEEADRLSRCEAPSCDRYFLRTHARRQWCSTRCGDRARAARSYARRMKRSDQPN